MPRDSNEPLSSMSTAAAIDYLAGRQRQTFPSLPVVGMGESAVGANLAWGGAFWVDNEMIVSQFGYGIETAAGNIDLGIYADAGALGPGAKIVSIGSFACPTARFHAVKALVASIRLMPGKYWGMIATDSDDFHVKTGITLPIAAASPMIAYKAASFPLPVTLAGSSLGANTDNAYPLLIPMSV